MPALPPSYTTIDDLYINNNEVRDAISSLKSSTSCGSDGISSLVLKNMARVIIPVYTMFFNKILNSGEVPSQWKEGIVVPIYKKGSKADPGNYRPICLTSISCKVYEKILKKHIYKYLLDKALLSSSQHGFMQGRSCATNMIFMLDMVTKKLDGGTPVDIIYLDYSKAFDKTAHKRLLAKMRSLGITGKILTWVENWLRGRRQKVKVGERLSSPCDVVSGVPQGSVLGPLLFLVFINDLVDVIPADVLLYILCSLFADDSKVAMPVGDDESVHLLQDVLNKFYEWSIRWCMPFNLDKCAVLHLGRMNLEYNYKIDNVLLKKLHEHKDVGIIVDKEFKFSRMTEEACRRANSVLTQITRAVQYRSEKTMFGLYKQYVLPHVEFSSPAWSPYLRGDVLKLERVQRRATRMIEGFDALEYPERLERLGFLSLSERRARADLVMVHGLLNGRGGLPVENLFTRSRVQRTRSNYYGNIQVQRARHDYRHNFFTLRVARMWNALPDSLKDCQDPVVFRREVGKYLMAGRRDIPM